MITLVLFVYVEQQRHKLEFAKAQLVLSSAETVSSGVSPWKGSQCAPNIEFTQSMLPLQTACLPSL